ncbi:hypothetical protein V8C42DRAFT_335126 [Trichoderma barbatum]
MTVSNSHYLLPTNGSVLIAMSAVICRKSLDTWVTFRAELSSVLLLLVTAMLVVYTDQASSVGLSGTQAGLAQQCYINFS